MTVSNNRSSLNPPPADLEYALGFLDSRTFNETNFPRFWLVEDIFVKGQPAVIGGPKKAMKTSVAVDMAISIGTGTPFLGKFHVPRIRNVALISGESGQATLQETALRISRSKKASLDDAQVYWSFSLPRLNRAEDREILGTFLADQQIQVVIIDPLYLCLLDGTCGVSASNLYEIGPLLRDVAETCLVAGATPIFVHHSTKTSSGKLSAFPELDDLQFAGIGEFVRQWILLKRQELYVPGQEEHHLMMTTGGSAGHFGCWDLRIKEGVVDKKFSGRGWRVRVEPFGDSQNDRRPENRSRRAVGRNSPLFAD